MYIRIQLSEMRSKLKILDKLIYGSHIVITLIIISFHFFLIEVNLFMVLLILRFWYFLI